MNLKKSIKGTQAIVPLNDSKAWNKLIREEMCDDISDEIDPKKTASFIEIKC